MSASESYPMAAPEEDGVEGDEVRAQTIVLGQTGISVSPYLDPPDGIELDATQRALVARINAEKDHHFFVKGDAGCGKTVTMRVLAGPNPRAMTVDMFLGHKPWKDHDQQEKDQRVIMPKSLKRAPRLILEEVRCGAGRCTKAPLRGRCSVALRPQT